MGALCIAISSIVGGIIIAHSFVDGGFQTQLDHFEYLTGVQTFEP
jgi:hypothetical protein